MKRLASRNGFWLVLSLALFLISGAGSALVQTDGGAVTQTTLNWATPSGKIQSAYLFVPNGASAKDKRPGIVLSHGYNNDKQMQDNNYVELARRGYVVISIDRYSQGSSTINGRTEVDKTATGTYEAVQLLASLPYVDASKIGVTGHSVGCITSSQAVLLDNAAPKQLIAAYYGVNCDPTYVNAKGQYANVYGNRDVGNYADDYDEFFYRTYDKTGKAITTPREYISTDNAQSFLNFGNPKSEWQQRKADTAYTETIGGKPTIREIDTNAEFHPWATFSADEVTRVLSFYNKAFGTPNPIPVGSQIWQLKAGFNGLGLIALGIFLVAFTRSLLATRAFAGLRTSNATLAPLSGGKKGLAWFWGALVVSGVFSGVSFVVFADGVGAQLANEQPFGLNPQGPTSFIGVWAAMNGIFALIVMILSYYLFGKKNGQNLREVGVFPGWKKFWLGILLGVIVVLASMVILFATAYFFQSDWRLYVLSITTFNADRIWMIFLYLPLYLIFYLFNSIAINSFNRFTIREREWVNTALLAVANALPSIIVILIQYITFAVTGELAFHAGTMAIAGIWLQFVVPFLIVTVIITRKIFRVTNNPYIGGFIMASIATIGMVSTTYTVYG